MTLIAAQRDSYLRELLTEVVSCEAAGERWAVRLSDTVLFAAGGGQPADRGLIDGVEVEDVQRDDAGTVVHFAAAPIAVGPASVKVDWARRYDLMQQHSAQHLITAIADDEFDLPTVSFHLGEDYCAIDFACAEPPVTAVFDQLVARVNAEIRASRPIRSHVVSVEKYGTLDDVRSRGLPDGHTGDVRLVEIEGLDLNTCGGTHVASTAELQVVRLGRVERVTSGVRVRYHAGGRVLQQLERWQARDLEIAAMLSCGSDRFVDSISKLQGDFKAASADVRRLRGELADHVARALLAVESSVVAKRLDDDDLPYLNAIANAVDDRKVVVLVGRSVFLVAGPEAAVDQLGPVVRDLLGARGGGRGGRFQGKIPDSADIDAIWPQITKMQTELDR